MTRGGLIAAAAVLLVAACAGNSSAAGPSPEPKVTVFAAASLRVPFAKIADQAHLNATFNFAGTQTLTTQLTQGAQADVFASADTAHMSAVQNAGLLGGTPKTFAHNRLQIAVAKGNPKHIQALQDLARSDVVVVLADTSVPAGKYAQQALAKAGVAVHPRSLELEVTAVLNKVALGEADAGIVYVSDVVSSGKVDGVAIPDSDNVIAVYPIAILSGAANKSAAQAFVDYVLSANGQEVLKQAGFERA